MSKSYTKSLVLSPEKCKAMSYRRQKKAVLWCLRRSLRPHEGEPVTQRLQEQFLLYANVLMENLQLHVRPIKPIRIEVTINEKGIYVRAK